MDDFKEKITTQLHYWLIGIISLVSLFVLPLLGTSADIGIKLPGTAAGWVVYGITNGSISIVNILIFHNFIQQGKLNIKDNERYLEATEILNSLATKRKEYQPMSPKKWAGIQYGFKGTTILLGSMLGVMSIGQAVIEFDYIRLISYFFTISLGLVFGVMQMKKTEAYFTGEYLDWAKVEQIKIINKDEDFENLERKELEKYDYDRQQGL